MMQIAWNLIRNAAKFTPAGGRLTIRTSNPPGGAAAEARGVPAGSSSSSRTRASGSSREVLPRIFDPFEQGRPTARPVAAGWAWAWRSAGRWPRRTAAG